MAAISVARWIGVHWCPVSRASREGGGLPLTVVMKDDALTGDGPRYQTGPSLMGRSNGLAIGGGRYPWKLNIVTTIFWVGERPSGNNPVPNDKSSWDKYWSGS